MKKTTCKRTKFLDNLNILIYYIYVYIYIMSTFYKKLAIKIEKKITIILL